MPACPNCKSAELTPLRKGGFLCEECNRRFEAASTPAKRTLVSRKTWDDPSLPFPIAHPIARAKDELLPAGERMDAAVFGAYQVIRLTGVLLLSDYVASTVSSRKVNLAVRALRAPDWWACTVLCNQLVRFWSGELDVAPDRDTVFPRLTLGWRSFNRKSAAKKESKWGTLLDGLAGRDGLAHSANDALWRAREDRDRRRGGGEDVVEPKLFEQILRVLEAAATRLFPKDSLELIRRVDARTDAVRLVRLHGAHLDGRFPIEARTNDWAEPFQTTPVIAIASGATVPVYPLFLRFDAETRESPFGGGGMLEVFSPAPGTGKTAILGARGTTPPQVFSPTLSVLRKKRVDVVQAAADVALPTLVPWASAVVAGTLESMRGRVFFPEHYVERRGLDDVVEASLETSGRALCIVGERGMGKTSLLARLAARLTRVHEVGTMDDEAPAPSVVAPLLRGRAGDLVFFLSGRNAFAVPQGQTPGEALCRTILRRAGLREDAYPSLSLFFDALDDEAIRKDNRRIHVLLDGVDEADDFAGTLAAIDDLLPSVARHSFLRVVVTMRAASFRALGNRVGAPEVPHNLHVFSQFHDGNIRRLVPYLEVRPFDADEAHRAFALRASGARASTLPYEALSPPAAQLLSVPLHLHLFHESRWGSSGPVGALDEGALFDAFLRSLAERLPRGAGATVAADALRELGAQMLEKRNFDVLAPPRLSRKRTVIMAPKTTATPDLMLLADAGLLLPAEDDGREGAAPLAFVHPSIGDEILLRALHAPSLGRWPTGEELARYGNLAATSVTDPFTALGRAMETLARRMAYAGEGMALTWLLTVEDEAASEQLLGAAIATLGPLWGPSREPGVHAEPLLTALTEVGGDAALAGRLVRCARAAQVALRSAGYAAAARGVERVCLRAIRAQIAADPEDVALQMDLAASLGQLSDMALAEARSDEARKLSHEALRLQRAVVATHPGDVTLVLALARGLVGFARLSVSERKWREARKLLKEAVDAASAAEALDPASGEGASLRADALDVMGEVATAEGNLAEARACLEEALRARRALASGTPRDDRLGALAGTLRRLGEVCLAAALPRDGKKHLDDAVTVLRAIVAREPYFLEAQRELLACLRFLGNLSRHEGRREEAKRELEEVLEGARWLSAHEPERPDLAADLAIALHDVGALSFLEGKRGRARKMLEESVAIAQGLAAAGYVRDDLTRELASALSHLGNVARAEGKHSEARTHFAEAVRVATPLAWTEPVREDRMLELANLHWSAYLVEPDGPGKVNHVTQLRALLTPLCQRENAAAIRLWELAAKVTEGT